MSPHKWALKANSNYIQGRSNLADSVNSAAFLRGRKGSPIFALFISKLASTESMVALFLWLMKIQVVR